MTFSREDMAAYEKQPQTQVADNANPFKGATPAKAADAAAVAAVKAGNTDATPAATEQDDTVTTPSGDDVDSGDQTVTGDGTSDDNADSSTASADRSGESETDSEEEGQGGDEAPVARPAPKKGSAAERVQEVLDLMEGYKEFGKHATAQLQEAQAEIARLKGGGTQAPKTETAVAPPAEVDDPMPDLSDPDINFDTDKLRAKTQKWVKAQIANGTRSAINEFTGQTEAQKVEAHVITKTSAFAATHPDWDVKVAKNPVLVANQLSRDAARVVAKSEHVAEILYAFGNDAGLAVKVAKQPVDEQLVTIGKLIAKIEAAKESDATTTTVNGKKTPADGAKPSKQKSLTQAPPPPSTTKAAGRPNERDVTDPSLDMDEFARRHREGKQAGRAASRKSRGLA